MIGVIFIKWFVNVKFVKTVFTSTVFIVVTWSFCLLILLSIISQSIAYLFS